MSSSRPMVSVLIPTYNQRPDFLRASLQSVFAQTFTNFEVVVSDNHSNNDAPKILAEFTDPRLRVVKPPKHVALVPNFHFAGTAARGRYISFLSSDDVVEPDWLETLVPLIEASPSSVVAFGESAAVKHDDLNAILYFDRDNSYDSGERTPLEVWKLIIPFGRNASWFVGGIMRADAYFAVDGIAQPGFNLCVDYTLLIKLLDHGGAIYANKLVGRHRVWGEREGKTDGDRSMRAIDDLCNLYDMVENSRSYKAHAEKLSSGLAIAKINKSKVLSLLLVQACANRSIPPSYRAAARKKILKMHSGLFTRSVTALAGFGPAMFLVDRFHGSGMAIYRGFFARRYNSNKVN